MANKICPQCGCEQDEEFKYCKNCGALLYTENNNSQSDMDEHFHNRDMKICPECGTQQKSFAKFCRNCGASFLKENNNDNEINATTKCSHCGAELNMEEFCPDCGNPTGIKICPNCRQKTVNEDFCSFCGYRINPNIKKCHNCGSKIDAKAKVCAHCGAAVIHKSPLVALVLSMIFPGMGQIYNEQNHKGVMLIAGYVISGILCLIFIGVVFALLIWIYGMFDAFVSAKSINNGEPVEDKLF